MPVIAIFAFINPKTGGDAMIIDGDTCGKFSFFLCGIAYFMAIADPAAFWFVVAILV